MNPELNQESNQESNQTPGKKSQSIWKHIPEAKYKTGEIRTLHALNENEEDLDVIILASQVIENSVTDKAVMSGEKPLCRIVYDCAALDSEFPGVDIEEDQLY